MKNLKNHHQFEEQVARYHLIKENIFSSNFISGFVFGIPFCQTGDDGGLESTSHFRDTEIPSLIGIPNPGILLIPKEGVSISKKRTF
jgi:hypothetical protein